MSRREAARSLCALRHLRCGRCEARCCSSRRPSAISTRGHRRAAALLLSNRRAARAPAKGWRAGRQAPERGPDAGRVEGGDMAGWLMRHAPRQEARPSDASAPCGPGTARPPFALVARSDARADPNRPPWRHPMLALSRTARRDAARLAWRWQRLW
eukprot:6204945-Prymnesium_polylepis.1